MEAATANTPSLPLQVLAKQVFGDVFAVKVERAAEALECSRSQIYRMLKDGDLEWVYVGKGKRASKRIKVLSLLAFLDGGGVEQPDRLTPAERLAADQRIHAKDIL